MMNYDSIKTPVFKTIFRLSVAAGLVVNTSPPQAMAQKIDTSRYRVKTELAISLPWLGSLQSVNANEIKSSNWLIGCETLDRKFTDYQAYKEYLVPLGIKRLRMQAGWARTETVKGTYQWGWLDTIVNDAVSRGLQPWLETSYGNSIYQGGGGENLSAGIPNSAEALQAWDKWVEALVNRYKTKVTDWEVWNEPNFGDNEINSPEKVAELNIRTSRIIKRVQPGAKISGLAMGHISLPWADAFFKVLKKNAAFPLFDNFTYHDYVYNPDANYAHVNELHNLLLSYDPAAKLRQGENGCPSEPGFGRGALGNYDWTELSQAKWVSRRMLGDLGHDIECSILGIIDMAYSASGPINRLNVKGLLMSDTNRQVIRPKIAYYAMQNIVSVFDDRLQRIKSLQPTFNANATLKQGQVKYSKSTDRSLAVYGYQDSLSKKQLFAIWSDEAIPKNSNEIQLTNISILNGRFKEPVFVDLLTGSVYQIPASVWSVKGDVHTFKNLPIYDSPILITDRSLIRMRQ